MESGNSVHWEPGSPTTAGVLRFLGRSGGGAHLAVARAFAGARSRVTYVLLRPSSPGADAAFRWPSADEAEGVLHSSAVGRLPGSFDRRCRPMAIGVRVVDLDTYLAPRVLPGWLRPRLDVCLQRRALRVCRCLLLRRMDAPCPNVEIGVRLSSLLGLPILGPRLRAAPTALQGVELVRMPLLIGEVDRSVASISSAFDSGG